MTVPHKVVELERMSDYRGFHLLSVPFSIPHTKKGEGKGVLNVQEYVPPTGAHQPSLTVLIQYGWHSMVCVVCTRYVLTTERELSIRIQ